MANATDERRFEHGIRAQSCAHPDRVLAELADRQHGVVARWQLMLLGVTRSMIAVRCSSGRLVPLHRGVYAVDGVEVDALWPPERVIVELDGYAYHHTRSAFERDRRKTNVLTLAGFTVLRFTHDDLVRRPERVAGSLSRALGGR
jgi:hypothetical protein